MTPGLPLSAVILVWDEELVLFWNNWRWTCMYISSAGAFCNDRSSSSNRSRKWNKCTISTTFYDTGLLNYQYTSIQKWAAVSWYGLIEDISLIKTSLPAVSQPKYTLTLGSEDIWISPKLPYKWKESIQPKFIRVYTLGILEHLM